MLHCTCGVLSEIASWYGFAYTSEGRSTGTLRSSDYFSELYTFSVIYASSSQHVADGNE